MATFFVDFVNGLDANNGLGPDASHASNKPWKTIAKLLGAAGMASGDTAYLSPAGPFRETVVVAMTSATGETRVLGDPANAQGFKTSGGVLVTPGDVIWTGYTTNDTTAPAGASLLNLSARDFLTFSDIAMIGGDVTESVVNAATAVSTNIKLTRCTMIPGRNGHCVAITGLADTALNWTIDSCLFMESQSGNGVIVTLPTSSVADWNAVLLIKNCVFMGPPGQVAVSVGASGALSFKGGGVDVYNCTFLFASRSFVTTSANISTSIPCHIYNSIIYGLQTTSCIGANAAGQIIEDYNWIVGTVPRTNVTAGANSLSSNSSGMITKAPLFEIGQALLYGRRPRPFGSPLKGSPLLGFGAQAGGPTIDFSGAPRPAGGASALYAIGAHERGNSFARETGTVRTGSNAISITGPGYHDFTLRVEAAATEVTAYVQWDATYAGTKPRLQVLNGTECGVADATATAVGASGAWELLTLNFTPTSKGIVKIRFLSSDTNGGGKMFADDLLAA